MSKEEKQSFGCDYMEGAHPRILERLMQMNMEKNTGYGADPYCEAAREKIKKACRCPQAKVHFLVGGTQTNATVIRALLAPYQGVIAAQTGHINVHESGAVEAGGHKVLALPAEEGKLQAGVLREYLRNFYDDPDYEHMVIPGMVYISHPTEYGTLYTADELKKIQEICKEYGLLLYMDGARLGYGLAAEGTDVTLPVIAKYCDAFYIGGTKVGALFGEAVVFTRPELSSHFFTIQKQSGAVLAKGWLLGVQFDTLFTDQLYLEISRHAIAMADKLEDGFRRKGYTFTIKSPTNQKFVLLDNGKLEELREKAGFQIWEKYDDTHTVVRFATSWATREEDVDALLEMI